MRSNMWKSTFREIKQSFGRFMAIFAITALGVSMFSGLKVIRPAMVKTTDQYFREKNFYDYRLLSTLGYEEEDVAFLAEQEQIRYIEGAVSFDILCSIEGESNQTIKTYNLPENISDIELLYGRLPENPQECVVDSAIYEEGSIGKKILLSDENTEDDLEHYAYREFTIVGIAQSPNYIQFERGNTSLGNGRISGFMYLSKDAFDVDYYTEILVKFDEDHSIYSDEYDAYMEEKEVLWEKLAQEAADRRYERILSDAEEKLADAEKELAEKKQEGEQELADAKIKLDDALKKLQESEQEIADGEKKLEEGRTALEENRYALDHAESQLGINQKTLEESGVQLEEGYGKLGANSEALGDGKEQLTSSLSEIRSQKASLESAKSQMEAMGYPVEDLEKQLEALTSAEMQILAQLAVAQAGEAQISASSGQIEAGRKQIEEGNTQLADAKEQVWQGRVKLEEAEEELKKAEEELADGKIKLADGWKEYEEGLQEYHEGCEEFETKISDAEKEILDAKEELQEIEQPEVYLLGRETNVGYVCMENDSAIVDGIANVFPVFFYAVAALVCVTTMSRMVEEQRTQIGVLKALGYSSVSIMVKYLFYSGLAAISGCLFGYFFGIWFFPIVIWYAYSSMYSVAPISYVFDGWLLAFSLLISCICSMGVTFVCCKNELSEVAAELMRPKAPKAGKRVLLERIPWIWSRMKFLHKVSYRNVFRYKKRFFMMVIGISGCTGLLVTGFGVQDSIATIAEDQYDHIQVYDINVLLTEEFTEDTQTMINEVGGACIADSISVMEKTLDLVTDEGIKSVSLVAIDENADISSFIRLPDANTREMLAYPGNGECILTDKISESYGISVGDHVILQDENNRRMELTVSGIAENYLYNFVYMTTQTYENYMGQNAERKSIYVNGTEAADLHRLTADLMKEADVASASVSADSKERFASMIESLDLLVVVIIICAGFLAFIVLYNLTNINITERIREIATIKVLGFFKNETASYIFRENLILTAIGAVAGLLLGKIFHAFVMSQVQVDQVSFKVQILPRSYLYSFLLTFVFAMIVNLFMGKKLDRVNMTESLKSVD